MPIVVIDPGHGGSDPGAVANGLQEKTLTLEIARLVRDKLESRYIVDARLTRDADVYVGLSARADYANQLGASYFVSLHHNAGGGTGFESFVYPGTRNTETGRRQDVLHNRVADFFESYGFPDRGKKEANFTVVRETAMPAVLLENLFLDTQADADALKDQSFLNALADAVTTGIADALSLSS
ncbi:N-acetylmuramoyl-L-alanine amidase [Halobacillus litoralis]|uniref:N-acetylmuramoyl-L-alanine amidase family protein n=1 Tax=Halobacillus litoralis TaxID=45668 RepID=UPI001CD66661|nr:N-acetylmuramoyl-L-alanine amidase [Halobacillus litoralis]MCA0972384.1 N-acetylmuramoyl-L-alanine amidase [Halobacillus litoralis]